MATLNPYLTFNGNCKEAMNFYKETLGGELSMIIAGESPMAEQMPAKYQSSVLHSSLKSGDFEIMATDMVPGQFNEGNTVHLCLVCKSETEIHSLYKTCKILSPLNVSILLYGSPQTSPARPNI